MPRTHRELARSPYIDRDSYMLSLLAQTPLILTPSRFVRDLYVRHGVPESRIRVMSLGLDLSPWRGATPNQAKPGSGLRVGYLGALLRHKGVDILLRAFRRLQVPGATLAIHGFAIPGDPFISQVRRFVAKDPRAMLMDRYHQEDLPAILRSIDVVIVPSLWHETFSIVAREALLSGTPVVASEVGALPEIVEHGRNGLLVPAGGVDALHGALQRLSVERGLLARLQDGARHSAKQIKSREEHVLEVEQIYESLQPAPEIP
jgi:glycosyltransferase involved in cell wall biosynthesis